MIISIPPTPTPAPTSTPIKQQSTTSGSKETGNKDKYAGWILYSTSDLKTLAENIKNGNVVYYNGQYLASPDFIERMSNENIVYSHDVAKDKK